MTVEKQTAKETEKIWDVRYSEYIPDEVMEELTPEILEQYHLWDQITKRELELYPWLILPLIKEVFHREYPANVEIKSIATEYVVRRMAGEKGSTLNSILADSAIRIGKCDIYHLECQMHRDKGMVLRMLEYDIHIGLANTNGRELVLPRSAILYLQPSDTLPQEETCLVRFADGTSHTYRVPTVNVQQYSVDMIAEKHLCILIPFLPIRFRKYLKRKRNDEKSALSETIKKELTDLIKNCMLIIEREQINGTLTEMAGKDLIEMLYTTSGYVVREYPDFREEIYYLTLPPLRLMRDDINALEAEKKRLQEETEKLQEETEKLQEETGRLQEETGRLQEETGRLQEETGRLQKKTEKLQTEREVSVQRFIETEQQRGRSAQEITASVQVIFGLTESEAEGKVAQYGRI